MPIKKPYINSLALLAQLAKMTTIKETDIVPTAGVKLDATGEPEMLVNPEFWKNLNDTEKSFLFEHELLHLVLNHHERFPEMNDINNIGCDLAINSILTETYDIKDLPYLYNNGHFIEQTKTLPRGKSADFYIEWAKRENQNYIGYNATGAGRGYGQPDKTWGSKVGSVKQDKDASTEVKLAAGQAAGKGAGLEKITEDVGFVSRKRTFKEFLKEKFSSGDIVKKTFGYSDRWGFHNGRLGLVTNVELPARVFAFDPHKIKKTDLLIFVDISGSCQSYTKWFLGVLEVIPDGFFNKTIRYFDDKVYDHLSSGYGGTSFDILVDEARKLKYDHVIVLTDGMGTAYHCDDAKDWTWLLTASGDPRFVQSGSEVRYLKEFVTTNEMQKVQSGNHSGPRIHLPF